MDAVGAMRSTARSKKTLARARSQACATGMAERFCESVMPSPLTECEKLELARSQVRSLCFHALDVHVDKQLIRTAKKEAYTLACSVESIDE